MVCTTTPHTQPHPIHGTESLLKSSPNQEIPFHGVLTAAHMLTYKLHTSKNYVLSEDGQELRPKHGGAIINKNNVLQVGINIIYAIQLHRKCKILNFFYSSLFF